MFELEKLVEPKRRLDIKEKFVESSDLIIYNDDVNTFEHVIDCLVAICDHSPIQAEQCALLTHINGKCDILRGEISELKPFQEDLELYGLNVQIL